MGEMPPSTMGTSGFTARIASAPASTSCANIFQSGSSLKSQCERLLGSFHNITASTIVRLRRLLREALEHPFELEVEHVLAVARLEFSRRAYPGLGFGMVHDLEPCGAQHRLRRSTVRDPPVRRIAGVLVLHEVRDRPARVFKDVLLPEVV